MNRRCAGKRVNHFVWCLLAAVSALGALPARAQAQMVQDCQPNQYLDRTASGADRELTWEFGIEEDPERCLLVHAGQTVVWNGDLDTHPLGGHGGDTPNPISLHQNGAVTFNTPGTFGYECLAHSPMIGAIKVVPAPSVAVPALSPWLAVALTVILLVAGLIVMRNSRSVRAAHGS